VKVSVSPVALPRVQDVRICDVAPQCGTVEGIKQVLDYKWCVSFYVQNRGEKLFNIGM